MEMQHTFMTPAKARLIEVYESTDPAVPTKFIHEMPWEDPEVVQLARKHGDDPETIWRILSPYAFSFKTWERLLHAWTYWIEFDLDLEDLALMTSQLGSVEEMEAALHHEFSN